MATPPAEPKDKGALELSRATFAEIRRLVVLRSLADSGLVEYLGGDRAAGNHLVVERRHGIKRLLRRDYTINIGHGKRRVDEPYWWSLGYADAAGRGAELVDSCTFAQPEMVTVGEAVQLFAAMGERITEDMIRRTMINKGRLQPFYPVGNRMLLARDQVESSGSPQARTRWTELERKMAPAVGKDLVRAYLPAPSPDPWPIRHVNQPGMTEARRRIQALRVAHIEGWLHFEYSDTMKDVYSVDVPAGVGLFRRRDLPGEGALPYALGHGDWHGQAHLIAYRDGLGSITD